MNILIVKRAPDSAPGVNSLYRGAARSGPSYMDALSDSEFHRLFRWYMDESVNGPLRDLASARRLTELLHQFNPKQQYELIEVVDGGDVPSAGTIFLGFDLIEGYGNSLIQWGLRSFASKLEIPNPIRRFSELIDYTFAPHLNAQGLFQLSETASFCLRSMVALQDLSPSYYEGGNLSRFRATRIFHVPSIEQTKGKE